MQTAPLAIAYALWVIFVLAWNIFDRSAKTVATPAARGERLHGLVLAFGVVLIVLAPLPLRAGTIRPNRPVLDWAMVLLIVAGMGWCWWARLHLGRLWSAAVTRKEGHRVVDTGPYRFVRHPIYTGFIVIYVGMSVICMTALAFAAVLVMTLGLWLKARREEDFLIEELGASSYGAYQARTPMLLPHKLPRPGAG